MKRKIYVETSVISYLTARPSKTILGAAHQQLTLAWWESRNQYELFVSESVLRECGVGDPEAAEKRLSMVSDVPLLIITEQALDIAESLVRQGIIPLKAAEDALHIAVATVNDVDYLLTWNCRHIANPEIQRNIAAYLEQIGLFLPFICTPEELLGEENAE
jgi:predicted nucleic acid-binding protein